MTYTLTGGTSVIRDADGATIPDEPLNADWQSYQAWLAAGNTPNPAPAPSAEQQALTQLNSALSAGLTVTWTTSTSLNGTYAVRTDPQGDSIPLLTSAEMVAILANQTFTNKLTTLAWPNAAGVYVTLNVAQGEALFTAIGQYVTALKSALAAAQGGGNATWPSASVTINQ